MSPKCFLTPFPVNIAECELSARTRQCLDRRMHQPALIEKEARRWATDRNTAGTGVDWQFTTEDARIKLKRLYPTILS